MSMVKRHAFLGMVSAVLLAGCAGPKPYIRAGFMDNPPKRVAVLPFMITYDYDQSAGQAIPESHVIGRNTLRKTFYYGLTPYGYQDVRLPEVDSRLESRWGAVESGKWRSASAQELGEALGADALIYGEISRIMHFSNPLYTETSLKASLRMVDATSGEILWKKQIKAAERGGALVKKGQVVDFVKDQVRSFKPEVKFLRIADQAVRQLLADFPNPSIAIEETGAPSSGRVRLAVLPFSGKPKWLKPAQQLRFDLIANVPDDRFEIVEPAQVDAALKALGWQEDQPIPESLPLEELAKAVNAGLVLRGTVTQWGRTYMIAESWVKAELKLELMEPESSEAIWSDTRKNTRHAGILKGPTGYKSLVTAPITGMKTSNLQQVGTHLARELAQEMASSPAVVTYLNEHAGAS